MFSNTNALHQTGRGEEQAKKIFTCKKQSKKWRIDLFLSPGQFLWRVENSVKYYMLSTWNFKVIGIAIECQWRKFKKEICYGIAVLSVWHSRNCQTCTCAMNKKYGNNYFFWGRCNYSVWDKWDRIYKSGELLKLSTREWKIY